jgi:AraC family transcriptional regulator
MYSNMRGVVSPLAELTGATHVLHSSFPYSWEGLLLEHHLMPAGECVGKKSSQHILVFQKTMVQCQFPNRGSGVSLSHVLKPGSITLMPSGEIPTRQYLTSSEVVFCAFEPNFVSEIMLAENDLAWCGADFGLQLNLMDSPTIKLIELLMQELSTGSASAKAYIKSLTYALTLRYLLLASGRLGVEGNVHTLPQMTLKRVLKHIEDALATDISLSALAQEVGYSRGHFLNMFRRSMGVTPYQYLLRCRIDRARTLLRLGNLSLSEIAVACGFSNQSHLTNVFREHVGTTPGHYRRIC